MNLFSLTHKNKYCPSKPEIVKIYKLVEEVNDKLSEKGMLDKHGKMNDKLYITFYDFFNKDYDKYKNQLHFLLKISWAFLTVLLIPGIIKYLYANSLILSAIGLSMIFMVIFLNHQDIGDLVNILIHNAYRDNGVAKLLNIYTDYYNFKKAEQFVQDQKKTEKLILSLFSYLYPNTNLQSTIYCPHLRCRQSCYFSN